MTDWTRLKLVTAPADFAITRAESKTHLRIDHEDDDTYLDSLIAVAAATVDGPYGIGICVRPQTWRLSLGYFPCEIVLPLGPVTAISSIGYTDDAGAAATVATWRVDFDQSPVRVWPARNAAWPAVTHEPGAVKVTFVAGYATVPASLKHAMLLIVGHLYENREAVTADMTMAELPMGAARILESYRVGRVA